MDVSSPHPPVSLERSRMALVDDLARRVSLSRATTLLHEALLELQRTRGPFPLGPMIPELEQQLAEERGHVATLEQALARLGGDSARGYTGSHVESTLASSIVSVAVDSRVDIPAVLRALLMAELVTQEGFEPACALAKFAGENDLVGSLQEALNCHARHISEVRSWVTASQTHELSRTR